MTNINTCLTKSSQLQYYMVLFGTLTLKAFTDIKIVR